MKKKNIILLSIIILLLLGGLYVFVFKKNGIKVNQNIVENQPEQSNVDPNAIVYYCEEGKIIALYGQGNVKLTFDKGDTVTMPQTISADGGRYESGNLVFWSKGDNAFMTEGDNQKYSKCVSGEVVNKKEMNTYTDNSKTFSFSYPNQFSFYGGDIGYSQDWSMGSSGSGILLGVVSIPKDFYPNTNFGEAKFTVGAGSDPTDMKNCLIVTNPNMENDGQIAINGIKFTKIKFTDVGAGNYYDTTSYRTVYNDQCYAVEYTIHHTNIANYSPDQNIKEFDEMKVQQILDNIVKSFVFLK